MHSPENKGKIIHLFNLINNKTTGIKNEIKNSMNNRSLLLSRNNLSNKKLLMKTKFNNTYKKLILNRQLSSENSSTFLTNSKKINNTTTNLTNRKKSINNSRGQILINKTNKNKHESLYKYLISKINENKNLYNKKNNYNNKFDLSMNILINNNQFNDGITYYRQNNNLKDINSNTNENNNNIINFQKILRCPLSPRNKSLKCLKLNNINLDDLSGPYRNIIINKDKENLSNINIHNNSSKDINNNIKIENSFIYHNTNNINLNVNIINKKLINDILNQNNYFRKIEYRNKKNLVKNFSNNNIRKNNNGNMNIKNNMNIGNLTNRTKNKVIKIKNFKHNINNNELFTYYTKSVNKEKNIYAEEIHFKAVKYIQEIKNNEKCFDNI